MATLYVENVPDDLYEALRNRAKARSIDQLRPKYWPCLNRMSPRRKN